MSVHIDVGGLSPENVSVTLSPLAELGMALHALAEPDHHPGLQSWARTISAGLDADLADRLCEADFLWRTTYSDVFFPFAGLPGGRAAPAGTLVGELDQLDELTDRQFVDAALEFTQEPSYGGPVPDPLGCAVDRRRALELAMARGPEQYRFTRRLLHDPSVIRAWLRTLLQDCEDAFFGDVWARVRGQLTADARHKKELLRRKGLAETLTTVKAVSLDEKSAEITVDKLAVGRTRTGGGGLALVPTSLGWPHHMVLHRLDWQPVIHYPVASPALSTGTAAAPSVEELVLRMEALAHPVRIRLCRHLARGVYTTSELADAHAMTAPEISRHLTVLKKAGLVTTKRRGRYVQHHLDLPVVARLSSDFIEGLLR
ncbi:DUF5937 family protein [Streptomyces monticola]|uniref:DUF5937 family protein n=1 Tax=Streptomyces monticola TaxID=2666263 RepID=A0ABW2JAM7_9ACTN